MTMSDSQASAGISKHLSALATSYVSTDDLYACEKVAVPLHQTGVVSFNFQRNQAGWSDLANTIRAKGQQAMQLDDENETLVSGVLDDHAARVFISERDLMLRAQAGVSRDQVIQNAVRRVSGSLMINREKKLADIITTDSNYGSSNYATVSNYWSGSTGTPIDDVLSAISQIAKGPCTGGEYYMVADESIWLTLLGQKQIRDAIGGIYTAATFEDVGRILHVRPVVCKAKYANGSSMIGKNAIVFKRPDNFDSFDESAPCSFRLIHNSESPITVRQYTTEDMADNGFWVQAAAHYQIIAPYGDANGKFTTAYLLKGLTA